MPPATFAAMDYFKHLLRLLQIEKEEDQRASKQILEMLSVADRRAAGMSWFPVAIKILKPGGAII